MYTALSNLSACYVTHDAIKTSNRCHEVSMQVQITWSIHTWIFSLCNVIHLHVSLETQAI